MRVRRYVLTVIITLYSTFTFAQNKTSVYVVAHPDDWQLFMGNDAYADIQDTSNKVVFIITTSGDATGPVKQKPNFRFARSRERGVLNSVRFCADMKTIVDSGCQTRNVKIGQHEILCYPYKHVKTYFMRLPDGCFNKGYKGQSMEYLHDGKIDRITTIDSSETYESWEDLVKTIRTIIAKETLGRSNITIHYQDHDRDYNPGDHPDHLFSGLAASQAAAVFPMVKHIGYMDYHIAEKSINLGPEEIAVKSGIFALADFGITEQGDGTSFDKMHLAFLTRTYSRKLPSVDSAGNPFFPPEMQVFPNPVSGSSVQLLYTMNISEKVGMILRDINGNILSQVYEIPTIKGENLFTLPLNGIAPGIYFITLITPEGNQQVKLVRL